MSRSSPPGRRRRDARAAGGSRAPRRSNRHDSSDRNPCAGSGRRPAAPLSTSSTCIVVASLPPSDTAAATSRPLGDGAYHRSPQPRHRRAAARRIQHHALGAVDALAHTACTTARRTPLQGEHPVARATRRRARAFGAMSSASARERAARPGSASSIARANVFCASNQRARRRRRGVLEPAIGVADELRRGTTPRRSRPAFPGAAEAPPARSRARCTRRPAPPRRESAHASHRSRRCTASSPPRPRRARATRCPAGAASSSTSPRPARRAETRARDAVSRRRVARIRVDPLGRRLDSVERDQRVARREARALGRAAGEHVLKLDAPAPSVGAERHARRVAVGFLPPLSFTPCAGRAAKRHAVVARSSASGRSSVPST